MELKGAYKPFKKNMFIVIYINREQFNYSFTLDNNILKQISKLNIPLKIELVSKGKIYS